MAAETAPSRPENDRGRPEPERLGLFGGTFDPPHAGHVDAVRRSLDVLRLDRILVVVANDPWQKSPTRPITRAKDRLAMTRAAFAGIERVEVSTVEIDRSGPTYTIDTVEHLRKAALRAGRPAPEIHAIVGADLAATVDTWQRSEDLRRLVTLAVVARPGSSSHPPPPGWRVETVLGGGVEVSSSEVRALVAEGRSIDGLTPAEVVHCITRLGLYAVGR